MSDSEEDITSTKCRNLKPIPDSTDESCTDSEGSGSDESEEGEESEEEGKEEAQNIDPDNSDGLSEKCAICLLKIGSQEIGTPESCDHTFCLECILEWSKKVNTCPIDRQAFGLILVREKYEGKIVRKVSVSTPQEPLEDEIVELYPDATYCEVCGRCDREERMLLCDSCDLGYHLECLDPPLSSVPIDCWYCPDCSGSGSNIDYGDIFEFGTGWVEEAADANPLDEYNEMYKMLNNMLRNYFENLAGDGDQVPPPNGTPAHLTFAGLLHSHRFGRRLYEHLPAEPLPEVPTEDDVVN